MTCLRITANGATRAQAAFHKLPPTARPTRHSLIPQAVRPGSSECIQASGRADASTNVVQLDQASRRIALLSGIAALSLFAGTGDAKASQPENPYVQVVKSIYAKLNTGDIPGVLDLMTEDVKWTVKFNGVTFEGQNKADVLKFLGWLDKNNEPKSLKPIKFFTDDDGDEVVAFVKINAVGKKTGKPFKSTLVHFWAVTKDRKIAAFREFADTALLDSVYPGNPNDA